MIEENKRVLLGMSGGTDSSVAAMRLLEDALIFAPPLVECRSNLAVCPKLNSIPHNFVLLHINLAILGLWATRLYVQIVIPKESCLPVNWLFLIL